MRLRAFLGKAKVALIFYREYIKEFGYPYELKDIEELDRAIDYCGYLEAEGRSRES